MDRADDHFRPGPHEAGVGHQLRYPYSVKVLGAQILSEDVVGREPEDGAGFCSRFYRVDDDHYVRFSEMPQQPHPRSPSPFKPDPGEQRGKVALRKSLHDGQTDPVVPHQVVAQGQDRDCGIDQAPLSLLLRAGTVSPSRPTNLASFHQNMSGTSQGVSANVRYICVAVTTMNSHMLK